MTRLPATAKSPASEAIGSSCTLNWSGIFAATAGMMSQSNGRPDSPTRGRGGTRNVVSGESSARMSARSFDQMPSGVAISTARVRAFKSPDASMLARNASSFGFAPAGCTATSFVVLGNVPKKSRYAGPKTSSCSGT